ncbi:MAG: DNA recombination protein RmuC, partial [Thiovulaceae bacterium]|nr:DNA recombination protein RmuC [Sulfurimonadaceae bacterium]
GAFLSALEYDSSFFSKAFEKNIMVVSPSTLLVTLRTIENIWRYEHQNQNALQIAEKAGGLYDKFVGFIIDIEKIGKDLGRANESYDSALSKLSQGKGNLVSRVEGLKKLGVKTKKELSAAIEKEALGYDT